MSTTEKTNADCIQDVNTAYAAAKQEKAERFVAKVIGKKKNKKTGSTYPAVCYFAKCAGEDREEYLKQLNIPLHTEDTEAGRIMYRLALAAILANLTPIKD